jgi:hypothetical protein
MEFHAPHKPATSFREFCREYAMIVLSILTALGLERVAVHFHDRAAAQDSRIRIEREINADLTDLRKALDFNNAHVTGTHDALKALIDDLKSAKPDPAKQRQIIQTAFNSQLSLQLPTWQHVAWDAAVADQSASHLDAADLRRYADLYTSATDTADATHIVLGGAIFDRIADVSVDLSLNSVDGREAARLMARFLAAAQQITIAQQGLLKSGDDGEKAAGK